MKHPDEPKKKRGRPRKGIANLKLVGKPPIVTDSAEKLQKWEKSPNEKMSLSGNELLSWPNLSEENRPRTLYVAKFVDPSVQKELAERGWELVDIRILPNDTDYERASALKATLEGVRVNSIALSPDQLRGLNLAARTYGLIGGKDIQVDEDIDNKTLNTDMMSLLNSFSTSSTIPVTTKSDIRQVGAKELAKQARENGARKFRVTVAPIPEGMKRKRGRPRLYPENVR